jgi:hypothetical protein
MNTIIGKDTHNNYFVQYDIRSNTPNNCEYYTIVDIAGEKIQEIKTCTIEKLNDILSFYLK